MTAYCVTGAGTEIGKTFVGAALLAARRAAGWKVRAVKPLMSGFSWARIEESDAGILLAACGEKIDRKTIDRICLHAFEEPLAPNVAARRAGVALDDDAILDFIRERISDPGVFALVEGAGGVMSPASDSMLQIDLLAALGLPVIFVAAAYLGAVSHSLTALEALDRRGLDVAALVVAQPRPDAPAPEELAGELLRWRPAARVAIARYGADAIALGREIDACLAGAAGRIAAPG
ncbi:MAG: dethiobiotin synthase [Alphaproteobacteria bacterium]|nr:dethiobiotin synthase [Alphaproteobacteria bacterium]